MGVTGTGTPYCALLKYIGFTDLDGIVFRKLYVFKNGAKLAQVSPNIPIHYMHAYKAQACSAYATLGFT